MSNTSRHFPRSGRAAARTNPVNIAARTERSWRARSEHYVRGEMKLDGGMLLWSDLSRPAAK